MRIGNFISACIACLLITWTASAQNYYWIGNGGNWDNPSHWSLSSGGTSAGSVPGLNNNVFFDANSFSLPGQVVVIPDHGTEVGVSFNTMDWRGVTNNPTFKIRIEPTVTTSEWIGNTVNGSIYFDDNMTIDFYGAEFYLQSSTDYNLDTRGHYMGFNVWIAINLNGSLTATCNLLSNINHAWLYVTQGGFNSNGFDISTQTDGVAYNDFWVRGTAPSTVNLTGSTLDVGTIVIADNTTLIDDGSEIIVKRRLLATGKNLNHIKFMGITDMVNSGDNSFDTFEVMSGSTLTLKAGTTQTVNNLTVEVGDDFTTLKSSVLGTTATISKATGSVLVETVQLRDIKAMGGATFTATNSVNLGNNPGWVFTNPVKISSADSLALVAFYNATAGAAWTNKTNWLTGPAGSWFGVTLNGSSVTELKLPTNLLTGSIPSSIGNLTALKKLWLNGNQLTGSIPTEIGNLSGLTDLRLYTNQLSGSIPTSIGNLSDLLTLYLHENQLTGNIPDELGNLSQLTQLYLSNNLLTGPIFPSIGNLTNLTILTLGNNELSGSIPSSITNLTSLTVLYLGESNLTGNIPSDIGNLTNLTSLNCGYNELSGTIPSSITNLTSLVTLNFFENNLTGAIPSDIGNLSNLESLELGFNSLSGSLPTSLCSITTLKYLGIYNNLISGTIPTQIGNLTSLEQLTLNSNLLTGPIPSTIGDLTNLNHLMLASNQLSGAIPIELGNLLSLSSLNLDNNRLNGIVPTELTTLPELSDLWLSNNLLTQLPDFSTLPLAGLAEIKVENNFFTFEDLEPNVGIAGLVYTPQLAFGAAQNQVLQIGQQFQVTFSVGGSANSYQWQKDGVNVGGATSNTITIPSVIATDLGNYQLIVTNSLVSGLTLISRNAYLVVDAISEGFFQWVNAGELTSQGLSPIGEVMNYSGQWGDFNNDGYEDLFTVGIAPTERSYLYKNNGNGTFSRISSNNYFFTSGRNVTWADYNNDGFLDCFAPSSTFTDSTSLAFIMKNNGDESFTKVPLPIPSIAGTWADTDNDGDLDLIVTYGNVATNNIVLYRNDGNDVFNLLSSFPDATSAQWCPVALDVNNDNSIDVFNPSDGNRTLHSGNGDNSFTFNSSTLLTSETLTAARGVSWADIDNDGDLDAYIMTSTLGNKFYINNGAGQFTSRTSLEVLGETVFGGRGSVFLDYDNDGRVDLLTIKGNPSPASWTLFRNNGNSTFTKQVNQTFRRGGEVFVGASVADYDNDGFVDIFSCSGGQNYNGLYRNIGNANNWLKVKLEGTIANRSAIGSKIDVYAAGLRRHQQLITSNGFGNQNSLILHFGLAASSMADSVVVKFPSGTKRVFKNVTANQLLEITEINVEDVAVLEVFYNATKGEEWTDNTKWLTPLYDNWKGVDFNNQGNVTAIDLSSNNLAGPVPPEMTELNSLVTMDLSDNSITELPDLTVIPTITSIDVSSNNLDFNDLEKNASIIIDDGLVFYNDQEPFTDPDTLFQTAGQPCTIILPSPGGTEINNTYQWIFRPFYLEDGRTISTDTTYNSVPGATQSNLLIENLDRTTIGDYKLVATNSVLELDLFSDVITAEAIADISGVFKFEGGNNVIQSDRPNEYKEMHLLQITEGGYDTIKFIDGVRDPNQLDDSESGVSVKNDNTGLYEFRDVLLRDYIITGFADTTKLDINDSLIYLKAIPTWYNAENSEAYLWQEADTLVIESDSTTLDFASTIRPEHPTVGFGSISGTFYDGPVDPEGKINKRDRVKKAGVPVSRYEDIGRGYQLVLILTDYVFTNDEGEFSVDSLEAFEYRLNLQYPGYPMDETSFIDIPIVDDLFGRQVFVEAYVNDNQIYVEELVITGWEEANHGLQVFPNPTTSYLYISDPDPQEVRFTLYDATGRGNSIKATRNVVEKRWEIDIRELNRGVYILEITRKGKVEKLRVIVQ